MFTTIRVMSDSISSLSCRRHSQSNDSISSERSFCLSEEGNSISSSDDYVKISSLPNQPTIAASITSPLTSSSSPSSSSSGNSIDWQNTSVAAASSSKKISLYKTELCRSWEETGYCRYGAKCQFAHDVSELRSVSRHPRYKTEICKTFWQLGNCPYGKRCCFIHTEKGSLSGLTLATSTTSSNGVIPISNDCSGKIGANVVTMRRQSVPILPSQQILSQQPQQSLSSSSSPIDINEGSSKYNEAESYNTALQMNSSSAVSAFNRTITRPDRSLSFLQLRKESGEVTCAVDGIYNACSLSSLPILNAAPLARTRSKFEFLTNGLDGNECRIGNGERKGSISQSFEDSMLFTFHTPVSMGSLWAEPSTSSV